jgi:hypothetical protein
MTTPDRVLGIAVALLAFKVKSMILDGKGVVCGLGGVTDFDRLRAALGQRLTASPPLRF